MKKARRFLGIMLAAMLIMGSSFNVKADSAIYLHDECRTPLCYDGSHLQNFQVYLITVTGSSSHAIAYIETNECCR